MKYAAVVWNILHDNETYSNEGQQILQHSHADKFSKQVAGASTAAEECERELELLPEVQKQVIREVHTKRAVALPETNWVSWEIALQSKTLHSFKITAEASVQQVFTPSQHQCRTLTRLHCS